MSEKTRERHSIYDVSFYDVQEAGSRASAALILKFVFALIGSPNAVVDVGCGVCTWLEAAKNLGAADLTGLDGPWVESDRMLIDPACFIPVDLTEANFAAEILTRRGRAYDLVMSMEVAEHLSLRDAESFVSNLCVLGDLVLFSAAIPGQGGTQHLNEQWPVYWSDAFRRSGFACFDLIRPALWNAPNAEWWYLQNALLFARIGSPSCRLLAARGMAVESPPALVHPRFHGYWTVLAKQAITQAAKSLNVFR
jgi:hypothetical protein